MNNTPLPAIMRIPEVVCLVKKSKAQIYRDIQAGTFPAPVKLGIRSSAWRGPDVQAWLDNHMTQSMRRSV